MQYKGHEIVVSLLGVQDSDRWQSAFSVHKATDRGVECVYRMDDPTLRATRDEAEDAAYRAARAWIDARCRVN
jgi:hypothetical protein